MKLLVYRSTVKWLLSVSVVFFLITSCQKDATTFSNRTQEFQSKSNDKDNGHLKQTKTFSSEVVIRWLNMQLDMLRVPLAPGTGTQGADRQWPIVVLLRTKQLFRVCLPINRSA